MELIILLFPELTGKPIDIAVVLLDELNGQ
jgi:hypothetical protein